MSSRRAISISPASATRATGASWSTAGRPIWPSEPLPQAKRPVGLLREQQEQASVSRTGASVSAEPASTSRTVPAPPPGQAEDDAPPRASPPRKADAGAGERGQRDAERGDGDDREVGARVDGEGVGRGEHVARHRLEGGARHAERDADEEPREQPGQPGGDDDGGVCLGVRSARR